MEGKQVYEAPATEVIALMPHARLLQDSSLQQRVLFFGPDGQVIDPNYNDEGDY